MKSVDHVLLKKNLTAFGWKMAPLLASGKSPADAIAKLDKKGDPIAKRLHPHLAKGKSYKEAFIAAGIDTAFAHWLFPDEPETEAGPEVAAPAEADLIFGFEKSDIAHYGAIAALVALAIALFWPSRRS